MGTLWWNGTFFTMEQEDECVEAVYTEDGVIQALGTEQDLRNQYEEHIITEVNVEGAFVYPGFVDSHLHMIGHGEKLLRLDLSMVTDPQLMLQLVKQRVLETERGEWIFADGWNENNFSSKTIFHRRDLDQLSTDHPMLLKRVCRHAALVNSKALALAGITKDTPDPPGGVIVRDEDGEPTGYLLDGAAELVKAVVPPVTDEYVERALQVSVDDLIRKGLVGGHTEDLAYYLGFKSTLETFKKVINRKERTFKAHLLVHHEAFSDMDEQMTSVSPYLELGAMKLFADGAFGGRTALLREPYSDDPETRGVAIHTQEQLHELVKKARAANRAVAIHTIGDQALDMALQAIEKHPVTRGRDRLIHTQVTPPDLVERMKKLPLVLDLQPSFVPSDFPWVEERLGEDRLGHSFAWKTLLNAGIHCAGGSDAPIEEVDPLLGIYAAVSRKAPGQIHDGYLPNEKLTPFQAVRLYTTGSAYAIEKEATRGKIKPSYEADFTILDRNLFTCDERDIPNASVQMTVIDEKVVYQKKV